MAIETIEALHDPNPGRAGPLSFGVTQLVELVLRNHRGGGGGGGYGLSREDVLAMSAFISGKSDLKANLCKCGGIATPNMVHSCGCDKFAGRIMKANLLKGAKRTTFEGKDYLVVPVVMLRADVVMNETLVPVAEIIAESWNGVPVTIGHPKVAEGYTSANTPGIMEKWACGTIFNARVDKGGVLKAEAWIDIAKAESLRAGLVDELEAGISTDVSTGFFSDDEDIAGEVNGREFVRIAHNLNPDHLALLPGGTGACSWEDGCGVRANQRKAPPMTDKPAAEEEKVSVSTFARVLELVGIKFNGEDSLKDNRRGQDDDYRQMVADLISDDRSPFVPGDEDSLRYMTYETLVNLRNQYLGGNEAGDVKANKEEGGRAVADETKDKGYVTAEQVGEIVANALKATLPEALKANSANAPQLSAEDRAALDQAKAIVANARTEKINKIVANSDMKQEDVEKLDDAALAIVANGIREVQPDYYGVNGFETLQVNDADENDEAVKAMGSVNARDIAVNAAKAAGKKELH